MNLEAPVNAGHRFANAAEDYEESENWAKAAETHAKAAEQFEIALNDATDNEASKTLRLLTSNHKRKAGELDRKAQRLLKAAANKRMLQMVDSTSSVKSGNGLRYALPQQKKNGLMVSRLAGFNHQYEEGQIGESYALLNNDDPEDDPFNKFLEAVEGLVQQYFDPAVAFTSAPLDENDNPLHIPTTEEVSIGLDAVKKVQIDSKEMMESYYLVPNPDGSDDSVNVIEKRLGTLSITPNDNTSNQGADYRVENEKLRLQIMQLTKRLRALELSVEENNLLKSSVLQFRNDVHKQAKRIMQSHHESSMRSSATTLLGTNGGSMMHHSTRYPAMGVGGNGGTDLVLRIKELEEENKQLQLQNEKQKVLMNRYKERWEMLKENAKKRRASAALMQ